MKLFIQHTYEHEHAGHQEIIVEENLDLAKQLFQEALDNGYVAIATDKNGKHELVQEIPPAGMFEQVLMRPNYVGG